MYNLVFSARSLRDLRNIQRYIELRASPRIAANYVRSISRFCETLQLSPNRGEERPHLRQGLRTIGFKRSVSIVFVVSPKDQTVRIARIEAGNRRLSQMNNIKTGGFTVLRDPAAKKIQRFHL